MDSLKTNRYLIVEDEEENRDLLLRLLINEYNISDDNIHEAENLSQAEVEIEEFQPNIIFLDLKIPESYGMEPEMINAFKIIQQAELYNFKQPDSKEKIKIIVVSGSIKDKGVQKIISLNKDTIFDFFDKGIIASDFDKFKLDFKRKLEKAIIYEGNNPSIDYSDVRNALFRKVQEINPSLWEKIDSQILKEFEKFSGKKANEFNISKSIIGTCGEIVEDVIWYFTVLGNHKLPESYNENEGSVLAKLTSLSGRKHIGRDNKEQVFELINQPKIRRISQEYALLAYRMRSQALHTKEGDVNNNKWFKEHKFTKEDAAISINLIVPFIEDYMEFKKR